MAQRLRYGQVQFSAMNWPFFAAEATGLFGAHDLIVERNVFTRPPDPVKGLLEAIKGAPLVVIANTNDRPQYRLMATADIQDARQLEGKRIGVNDARSAESLILRKMLRAYGLKDGAYELVSAGPPMERCEKLRAGVIAATMVTEPFHFLLEKEGFIFVGSSVEAAPAYPFTVAVAQKTPELDERFVNFLRALLKSWEWLANAANRGRAVEILSAVIGTENELAEKTYELYLNPPSPPSLEPTEHGVAAVLELLADSKRLPMPLPPARRYIDRRYFEKLEAA